MIARALRRAWRAVRASEPSTWLEPVTSYRIDARVPSEDMHRMTRAGSDTLERIARLPQASIDWQPPAAGPTIEISWRTLASTSDHALRAGTRELNRMGLEVLAIRARREGGQEAGASSGQRRRTGYPGET